MNTLVMPIRTNRVATSMVIAGIAGAVISVIGYVRDSQERHAGEAAAQAAPAHAAASSEQGLCKLARELADAPQANLQQNGEGLRKAANCSKP